MAIFVTVSAFVLLSSLIPKDTLFNNKFTSRAIVFIILALFVAYIPFLNVYVSDMLRYVGTFQTINSLTFSQIFIFEWEPLFLILQWSISRISSNEIFFVLSAFLVYFFLLHASIKKLFAPSQRMFVVFLFFCSPFFFAYIFNGMRQGFAMMLLMLAIVYWIEKPHSIKFYISTVAAGLFHYTAFVFSFVLFALYAFKLKLRTVFIVWLVTAILFVTGLNSTLMIFGFISNLDYIETYTSTATISQFGGKTNKLSFFIFSSFFVFLSLYLYKKMDLEIEKKKIYSYIIKAYIAFNSVFLLFGFISFSNRLSAFSWHLIPLIITFPLLHKKGNRHPILLFLVLAVATIIGLMTSPFIQYG